MWDQIVRRGEAEWHPDSTEAPILIGLMAMGLFASLWYGISHLVIGLSIVFGKGH